MLCLAILATFSLPVPHYTEMIINCIIWSLGKLTLRKHDNWMSKNCLKKMPKNFFSKKMKKWKFLAIFLKNMKILCNFFKMSSFFRNFWHSVGNFPGGEVLNNISIYSTLIFTYTFLILFLRYKRSFYFFYLTKCRWKYQTG